MESRPREESPRPPPAVKRRRVAIACDSCRLRKSRCDSTRPQCSSCIELGFECVYRPPATATNIIVQKDYLQSLESRVHQLEDSLSTVKDDLNRLSSRVSQGGGSDTISSELDQHARQITPLRDLAGTEDSVDAMGTITLADEEDSGFFGPSSNVAFTRHLCRAIGSCATLNGAPTGLLADTPAYDGGFVSASRPPSPPGPIDSLRFDQRGKDIFKLPPPSETLSLIKQYFTNTGLLFPYIHPPTFLQTYEEMVRDNFKRVRRTWLGLLNIILAMVTITASPYDAPANTRVTDSDVFYQRSLGLCRDEILRGTTLEVVQYLLLMGQYLQGTQKSVQAWTVHGLAVKAALQLGLHSKDASRAFSRLDKETRLRTWFGCVLLDRTLSMTFGRPAAIPNSYVKLDLPAGDTLVDASTVVDDQTSSLSLSLYNATITLYNQIAKAIDLLYGQNVGCDPPASVSEIIAHVFSLEQDLFSWERSLPDSVRLINLDQMQDLRNTITSDFDFVALRFRIILTLRYSNFRVLLHRPVLVRFLDSCGRLQSDPQQLQLLQQLGLNSIQISMDSTMLIIDLIHDIVHRTHYQHKLLGAWWFSLYYTFNAALVILGILIICREGGMAAQFVGAVADKIRVYPFRAAVALSKLDSGNRMVNRCRVYLERLISTSGLYSIEELSSGISSDSSLGFPFPPPADLDISPLGVEFGEFMLDGNLFASINPPAA
ncbi:fungal-specific transcription factor domain-containing protein [Aspergillus pseudodeflectus]|uniref:Fungal-specific transcription factor domain-containing protein n=1 Tax=Aspergillus pseudodeflectus TaxID=176178 RepID=A0ABR4JBM2_9EURO